MQHFFHQSTLQSHFAQMECAVYHVTWLWGGGHPKTPHITMHGKGVCLPLDG